MATSQRRSQQSVRRRRETRRVRERGPKLRLWPTGAERRQWSWNKQLAEFQDAPGLPDPVSVYAGSFEAAVVWRDDKETFAALLTDTTAANNYDFRWFGETPGQYPTVESLNEALTADRKPLDRVSLALSKSYQNEIWRVCGPCEIIGVEQHNGSQELAIVTPKGKVQRLLPEQQRSRRSEAFGETQPQLGWGKPDRTALETARVMLEMVDSTTRTNDELFDDAREFAQSTIRYLPPQFSVSISEINSWGKSREIVIHRTRSQAIDLTKNQFAQPKTKSATKPGKHRQATQKWPTPNSNTHPKDKPEKQLKVTAAKTQPTTHEPVQL